MSDFTSLAGTTADMRVAFHCPDVETTFRELVEREFSPSVVNNFGHDFDAFLARYSSVALLESLDSYNATTLVGHIETVIGKLKGLQARAVVAAVGIEAQGATSVRKGSDVSLEDVRSTELGAYLNISPLAARNLAETCRALVRWLPITLGQLNAGNIDEAKARIVANGSSHLFANACILNPEIVDAQDPKVLDLMESFEIIVCRNIASRTRSQVRQAVNRAIAQLTPLAEKQRFEVAKDSRGVEFFEHGDGMTLMQALLTNLEAAKVKNTLEFCARNDESLEGTMPQRCASALVNIIIGESEIQPERRMSAAQVNVVVSAETLLGISNEPATLIGSEFALTAEAVRELAQDSHLRRMIVDSTSGAVLELGRRSYEPSRQIKDFVKLRDQKCRAPGCVRNAMRCDVDHVQAWDDGGETNVDNLVSLCRRHHVLKTIGNWKYELKPNGDTIWTLPNGHVVTDYFEPPLQPAQEHAFPF